MAAFEYCVPGLFKTPANIAGAECERLQNSEQGLSPATLLDASRDVNAPLHGEFEWRDDVAAEKYRLGQAQRIIQNLRIVVTRSDGTKEHERSFVVTPGGKSVYVTLSAAMSNESWKKHLLEQAKEDATIFLSKYRRLEELSEVNEALTGFVESDG